MPFGKTKGSVKVLSNEKSKQSLSYRLKSNGLQMQPWRTSLEFQKGPVNNIYGTRRIGVKT